MIRLREHNFERIKDLKGRKATVESWKQEYAEAILANRPEKIALANVVIEHFSEYIQAYELKDVERIIESAIRHIAICKVAVEILADPKNQTTISNSK